MLTYRQYKPSKLLDNFIECFWICKAPDMTMSPLERLIPGGRTEMIFNFSTPMQLLMTDDLSNGQSISDGHIMGQRSHICYTKQNGDTNLLGVRFKPGGITAFANFPAADLMNKVTSVEDIFGTTAQQWKSRLLDKYNEHERIILLDTLLIQLLKGPTKEWADCNKAANTVRSSNIISVNALCNEKESYYKKLERDFIKYIGYTPKYYCRLVRFNKAIRLMWSTKNSLTTICYDCGYYDQSHFIKDFSHFTGTTPRHFLSEQHTIADFLIRHQTV